MISYHTSESFCIRKQAFIFILILILMTEKLKNLIAEAKVQQKTATPEQMEKELAELSTKAVADGVSTLTVGSGSELVPTSVL